MNMTRKQMNHAVNTSAVVAATIGALLYFLGPATLWKTADQYAQSLEQRGAYQTAAEHYTDPMRRGIALYRDAKFEAAAGEFVRVSSAAGNFNRGNALLMAGKYEGAIEAYQQALTQKPGWSDAQTNLEIARIRAARMMFEGGDMTGGQLGADDFVFSSNPSNANEGFEEVVEAGQPMSDQELQALWLQRVQTKPADFLRMKFSYQVAVDR